MYPVVTIYSFLTAAHGKGRQRGHTFFYSHGYHGEIQPPK